MIDLSPAGRSDADLQDGRGIMARNFPDLGITTVNFEPIGISPEGRLVGIYVRTVDYWRKSVWVLTLDRNKGPFKTSRSPCVVGKREIGSCIYWRGGAMNRACEQARQIARGNCAIDFMLPQLPSTTSKIAKTRSVDESIADLLNGL